jgi:hypothetical protein
MTMTIVTDPGLRYDELEIDPWTSPIGELPADIADQYPDVGPIDTNPEPIRRAIALTARGEAGDEAFSEIERHVCSRHAERAQDLAVRNAHHRAC